jgi:3-hydroxybutyryl-CoA dehydrogenase
MNIAIFGNDDAFIEAKATLGDSHNYFHAQTVVREVLSHPLDVIFDFTTDFDTPKRERYGQPTCPVFLNSVFTTLESIIQQLKMQGTVFGFCGLPTFFKRSRLEIVAPESAKQRLKEILTKLNVDYTFVKDEIGMVTPRVVCMIINEAYETLHQGVASREDIDLSMKLGTNYPFGPFEWGDKIGLEQLRKLMLSLKDKTSDPRFNPNF